jgi:hypothetical protein
MCGALRGEAEASLRLAGLLWWGEVEHRNRSFKASEEVSLTPPGHPVKLASVRDTAYALRMNAYTL